MLELIYFFGYMSEVLVRGVNNTDFKSGHESGRLLVTSIPESIANCPPLETPLIHSGYVMW